MERVPRERFVPDEYRAQAYEDRPLPIGEGQTISQPYIVAVMTEAARLSRDDRVLEIGTGSGYHAAILAEMDEAGCWARPGPGYNPKYRSTVWSIILLAQLGASVEEDKRLARACAYLVDHALAEGGQFSTSGAPSGTIDCLQGNLCWALLELGYADPRLAQAFKWMARTVTGEGMAPVADRSAAMRYYAYKCGPGFACGANNKLPCAWGAIKVMLAFSKVPARQRTPLMKRAIKQGVAFLFTVDPATAAYPTPNGARPNRSWWKFGFPVFYVTDLLQNVAALAALGYGRDPRLAKAVTIIRDKQDEQGRWLMEYDYTGKTWGIYGRKQQPTARAANAQGGGVMALAQRTPTMIRATSLRSIVLMQTRQDVSRCCSCALCEEIAASAGDVSLSMVMQWILANDERALTNATVWSDEVLREADHACANQLNIPAVLWALREEARRRGL
jgi:hypothetical protein